MAICLRPAKWMTSFGDVSRTWLGYVTFNQVGNPGSSNGTATVAAPATLTGPSGAAAASVTPDSARGLDQPYTFGYPVTEGAYTEKGVGTIPVMRREPSARSLTSALERSRLSCVFERSYGAVWPL